MAEKKPANKNYKKADGAPRQAKTAQGGTAKKTAPKTTKKTMAANYNAPRRTAAQRSAKKTQQARVFPVKVIPLGGLDEIGKNITVFECRDEIIIVDCGMSFPDETMPGIDIVIPDFTYLIKNKEKVKALFVTHGHEDHIGSIPYLLKEMNIPVYGTALTIGLIEGKLKEHRINGDLHAVKPGERISAGCFNVEFIHVNHSIPDAVAFAIRCPGGLYVHTGDFKIDPTPIDGAPIDLGRFAELGNEGVTALFSDSTNAERQGSTPSEKLVGSSLSSLFARAQHQRIIVATFSSNIHRMQQIIDEARKSKRKVAVSGRSMLNAISVAEELGYIDIPEGILIDIDMINRYTPEQIVIMTTGSQGEPMSALHRMAFSDHRKVSVGPGDMIIISATPIPGNERFVTRVINELMKLGADVIYEKMYDIHVSGHACSEELKLIMGLVKPKFFMPLHGEFKHLYANAKNAVMVGINSKNIMIAKNGSVIEFTPDSMKQLAPVQAGMQLVDGFGVGDVGNIVLRDRRHLAEDGLIVVAMTMDSTSGDIIAGPDIVSRGFIYVKEAEELMEQARNEVCHTLAQCRTRDWNVIKAKVKDELSRYLYIRTGRSPMILPVMMQV